MVWLYFLVAALASACCNRLHSFEGLTANAVDPYGLSLSALNPDMHHGKAQMRRVHSRLDAAVVYPKNNAPKGQIHISVCAVQEGLVCCLMAFEMRTCISWILCMHV